MQNLSKQELFEIKSELESKYNRYKSLGLKLDMSACYLRTDAFRS